VRDNVGGMERRGDYGDDAPYALLMFAALGASSLVAAIAVWWTDRGAAAALAVYAVFFVANAGSFVYTARRGKFRLREEILDSCTWPAANASSTWAADAARS
jgi:hypothetical protein